MKKEKTKNVTLEPIAEADRVPLKEKLAYVSAVLWTAAA